MGKDDFGKSISPNDKADKVWHRVLDGRQSSHFLTILLLTTEPSPSEQTLIRRTSPRAEEAARVAWGWMWVAAWTQGEATMVTAIGPPKPGSRSTALHWCSSLTTRTPTTWVTMPFPSLVIFILFCYCVFGCLFFSAPVYLFSHHDWLVSGRSPPVSFN